MKRILVPLFVVLLLAGCASHPAAKPFKTHYGQSAVTIANHIRGCKDIALVDIGDGAKSGLTSGAKCTLDGREITVDSYKDADSSDAEPLVFSSKKEQYWASGTGWTAFETDDSIIQLQLTNNTKALTTYVFGGTALPTHDVSGEKTAAKAIAKSLHGMVQHYAGD